MYFLLNYVGGIYFCYKQVRLWLFNRLVNFLQFTESPQVSVQSISALISNFVILMLIQQNKNTSDRCFWEIRSPAFSEICDRNMSMHVCFYKAFFVLQFQYLDFESSRRYSKSAALLNEVN